ncbi:hypothetical protein [Acidipropionibacterium jensenii]|uniref:Uncharacterized protein n=1 Tax=Acidipropionibacterium jensenii TaxID=1749 RepID=A0A3Q9ULT4_9ACTN|nr:hypothetical protein [Acidipropionibacterium jensenii]AZZ40088.1 hypothetical protein C0Z10_10385 [Acidipropionibacterium jensenii]MDN5978386.1 hypothetical protein [Acidipropionibacterium jensenii]MDN5997328.1 hypothetical protein [Acidipropionibacterium jensenii]MDN6021246.1 hypothetical protein [Acidipropionibacterium jensenii]MDN6427825.1 hypothetical protein [Acidipropionibacterium jensenii]
MVESMLDMTLGHWWRSVIAFYLAHFTWIVVPLVAWMAVIVIAHRVIKDAEQAMRATLIAMPNGRIAPEKVLRKRLLPVIRERAAQHRWMPAGPGGIWIRRCRPDDVVAQMTKLPNYLIRFRDQQFGTSAGRRRRSLAR